MAGQCQQPWQQNQHRTGAAQARSQRKGAFGWEGKGGPGLETPGQAIQHIRELLLPCPWDRLEVCSCSGQPTGVTAL